ncbi:hypothetical protein EL26_04170 [Tumebacillus flagellatus]|uniref:Uncharacterized protein n=1 Tax=Tumebacillus flagellatus TaxID=1157490 RepID=A0A074LVY1_9BACL|nr:hypothetical protein EL26_04170 [Tumebacillus flagellatus]
MFFLLRGGYLGDGLHDFEYVFKLAAERFADVFGVGGADVAGSVFDLGEERGAEIGLFAEASLGEAGENPGFLEIGFLGFDQHAGRSSDSRVAPFFMM